MRGMLLSAVVAWWRSDEWGSFMTRRRTNSTLAGCLAWLLGGIVFATATAMVGCPRYHVWEQGLAGQAELKRAEQNRQIKIQEAKAVDESAALLAEAEVKRAMGVAKANAVIGESLKGNEAYLRWLYIEGLKENKDHVQIIYVPTEAGLPILEAGRTVAPREATR